MGEIHLRGRICPAAAIKLSLFCCQARKRDPRPGKGGAADLDSRGGDFKETEVRGEDNGRHNKGERLDEA